MKKMFLSFWSCSFVSSCAPRCDNHFCWAGVSSENLYRVYTCLRLCRNQWLELPHDCRGFPYSAKYTVNMLCFAWLLSAKGVCGRSLRLQWVLFQWSVGELPRVIWPAVHTYHRVSFETSQMLKMFLQSLTWYAIDLFARITISLHASLRSWFFISPIYKGERTWTFSGI